MSNYALLLATVATAAVATPGYARQASPRPASEGRVAVVETHEGTGLSFDVGADGTIVFDLLGQLWLLPAEGGTARALTNGVRDTAQDADPSTSPDGRWIVFRSDRPAGAGLWLISSTGGDARRITPQAFAATLSSGGSWSPDSRSIVFVAGDSLRVFDIALDRIRTVDVRGLAAPGIRHPVFSSDGARIIFINARPSARNGGPVLQIQVAGGDATPLMAGSTRALAIAPQPGGPGLAWIGRDTEGNARVFVAETDRTDARMLAMEHRDVTPYHVRWSPGGRDLIYAADGRLWRAAAAAGTVVPVEFTARLELPLSGQPVGNFRTPDPGSRREARGFMGLALAPDALSFAVIALGRLWHVPVGGAPRVVHEVPPTAAGLSWSPDGHEVVWSAGAGGGEDLFVSDVRNGAIRRLTALHGREDRAGWSPDGRHIAFLHWRAEPADSAPWQQQAWQVRIRVVRADARDVDAVDRTVDLGIIPGFGWSFSSLAGHGQERPQWSAASDGVLRFGIDEQDTTAVLLPLDGGQPRTVRPFPARATFVSWAAEHITFISDNQLWRAPFDAVAGAGTAERLSADAALYPSIARDGSVLHVSADGLRLRVPDGSVRALGWPLGYAAPDAAAPLLIRNARVIDGTGAEPQGLSDILVREGRIAAIAPAATTLVAPGSDVLDVGGRTVIPGLIDLHAHLWDDAVLPSFLAYGVTSGREMGTNIARAAGYRDAVDAGAIAGMRLVPGGFQFNPSTDGSTFSGSVIQQTSGRASADRALSLAAAIGAEYVKMRFPGGTASGVTMIAAARERGLRISGHCAISLPFIAAGLSGKEHLGASCEERFDGPLYGDVAALLRGAEIWVVPTITAFASVPRLHEDSTLVGSAESLFPATPFLSWWMLRLPPTAGATYARFAGDARTAAARLHREGVMIGVGADVPAPGWILHMELEELVRIGMSPLEAITAATGTAGRILGADDLGFIRPGSRADLVVLNADPLEDIRNTRSIFAVLQAGRIIEPGPLAAAWRATPVTSALGEARR